MTPDDELTRYIRTLMLHISTLDLLIRNRQFPELSVALDEIHDASRKAGWRVNDLRRMKCND